MRFSAILCSLVISSFPMIISLSSFATPNDDNITPNIAPNVAPAPQSEAPSSVSIWHRKWDYNAVAISNREVFRSKSYWGMVGADFAAGAFDSEMSKHQGGCIEGGDGLSPHPTRWQLYQHNLPEEVAVLGMGYFWTKIRGPKWAIPMFLAYPAQAHIRAGMAWEQHCW